MSLHEIPGIQPAPTDGQTPAQFGIPDLLPQREQETGLNPIGNLLIFLSGEQAAETLKVCQRRGTPAILAYSDETQYSEAVRLAKELATEDPNYSLVHIGGGDPRVNTFGNVNVAIRTAFKHGCDAIYSGYDDLSESPEAVKAITEAGLRYVGPDHTAMRQLADKGEMRKLAKKLGLRDMLIPGGEDIKTESDLMRAARDLDGPFYLKFPREGGGRGNFRAENIADLVTQFRQYSAMIPGWLEKGVDVGVLMFEQILSPVRHVEQQVMRDKHGNTRILGLRNCSAISDEGQKYIEYAFPDEGNPIVPEETATAMTYCSTLLMENAGDNGYEGVATVEYLIDSNGKAYLLEVNTRLQVEEGITATIVDENITDDQLSIEEGEVLPEVTQQSRAAMQIRINTRDPYNRLTGTSGKINHIDYTTEGIGGLTDGQEVLFRVGYRSGDTVPPGPFQPLPAKVLITVPYDPTNPNLSLRQMAAIGRRVCARIGETYNGPILALDYVDEILASEEFQSGNLSTVDSTPIWERSERMRERREATQRAKEEIEKARRQNEIAAKLARFSSPRDSDGNPIYGGEDFPNS